MGHNTYKKGDIMNTKKWAAMLGLLCLFALALLVGCSKKENTSEEQATSPAKEAKTASTPIDPATAATVSGTSTYSGAVPKQDKIEMSQDPTCKGNNMSETIVADNGKLANVFVYVKDGLGDRTFDVPKDAVTLDQKGCQYHPHVLGVMTGQNIEIKNDDPTTHNIHPTPKDNRERNESQPPRPAPRETSLGRADITRPVTCTQPPALTRYTSVLKPPFIATTAADRRYE